ncbi:MAG: helix-turn-helix domain-containing protein [Bacteriovoracaceae bacterium]|nr:helix-turn-helix domain-containing protein [Bacteriovoracaceae bacterium]
MKQWMTSDEVAIYLGRSKNAIWLLVSRGLLVKRKLHGRLYFKKSEIDRLIDSGIG